MRYYIEIKKIELHYEGRIHTGIPYISRCLPDMKIKPEDEVSIKNKHYPLGELLQAFIQLKRSNFQEEPQVLQEVFGPRGLLEFGQYLYSQLFPDISPIHLKHQQNDNIEVIIVTQEEHVTRLPWMLLAYKGQYLCMDGEWSIAIATTFEIKTCEMPSSPRILIIAPEPTGQSKTKAESHIKVIEEKFCAYDINYRIGYNLEVVYTIEDFKSSLEKSKPQPHIVYFYGHGIGDFYTSMLVFATRSDRHQYNLLVRDFSRYLSVLRDEPPMLVYLNCCHGDAGGLLGAGFSLGNSIPAVITNRTVAEINAAQAQGLYLLNSIVIEGKPPHLAISEMYKKSVKLDIGLADPRWMTPILYQHYTDWKVKRLPLHDSNWHYKLDHVTQFCTVASKTRSMLNTCKPRSLAFVWYGKEGVGCDILHEHLKIELHEHLDIKPYEVNVKWPLDLGDRPFLSEAFTGMLSKAFEVPNLNAVPARIRARTFSNSDKLTLICVHYQPVMPQNKKINPTILKYYLEWWDCEFVPLLEEQQFVLSTISFVVKSPDKFRKYLDERCLDELDVHDTAFRILDEIKGVSIQDLLDFLYMYKKRLTIQSRKEVLKKLLNKTSSFRLSRHSFINLRQEEVPDSVLEALKEIKDQGFIGQDTFLMAIEEKIGHDQTVKHKEFILKHANIGGHYKKTVEELRNLDDYIWNFSKEFDDDWDY